MVSTKIEFNWNGIKRIQGLDELAAFLCPGNRNHQRVLLAIFIELKYAEGQFLPNLLWICDKYELSPRMLETVRSKMRRIGIIDHVSRFNRKHGYREGWVFSKRFQHTADRLEVLLADFRNRKDALQERKDRDLFMYI